MLMQNHHWPTTLLFGKLQVKNSESAILMPAWTVMLGENYCFEVLVFNATVVGVCMVINFFSKDFLLDFAIFSGLS